MKKWVVPVLLASLLFLAGMGDLGGGSSGERFPVPEKNFSVVAVDREGVKTTLIQFNQEGRTSLAGKRGSASVTIPFEKIGEVQNQGLQGNEALVRVKLKDQKITELRVDKRSKFYGRADFGTFQIELQDLKSLSFQPAAP
ncbi:MAG: hypothetical protein HY697_02070 [Deltaproteobacteria bacterium]|nr:hypothetical protein [Deltaproteobacteria bacterium]